MGFKAFPTLCSAVRRLGGEPRPTRLAAPRSMARRQTSDPPRTRGPRTQRRPEHLTEQRARPPIIEMRRVTKVYPGGHVGLEHVSLRGRPRRVRLPRRPDRLRQVDPDQDADPRAPAHRGRGPDRRPRHRLAGRQEDPAAAPPDRHRLPGLQAAARPHRLRQRRLRAAGDRRRRARRSASKVPRRPAPGRPRRQAQELPRPALRRRAAAPLRRPRLRQPPAAAAGGRADRQPRPGHLDRDHAAALPDQPDRHHRRGRHPRPRDGRQDAPPRDRARLRPRRPRPGRRRLHPTRSPHASSRCGSATRWASRARSPATRAGIDGASLLLHPRGLAGAAAQRRARAWRRSSPSLTVLLLGVLIPVLQTDQRQEQPGPRPGRTARLPLRRTASRPAGPDRRAAGEAPGDPARQAGRRSSTRTRRCSILSERLKQDNREDITAQLPGAHNPLPRLLQRQARRPRQPPQRSRARSPRPGRTASRRRSARSSRTSATRATTPARSAVPPAIRWVLARDHRRCCWSPRCCWSATRSGSRSTPAAARSR